MWFSATTVRPTSEIGDAQVPLEKWKPATSPSSRARLTSMARRPLREVIEVVSRPDADSSLTMFETVAGERPVAPASSTWVRCPWCLSESTMRARLASRSEVCEPGVGLRLATCDTLHAALGWGMSRKSSVQEMERRCCYQSVTA